MAGDEIYEVFALRYATRQAQRRDHFLFKDRVVDPEARFVVSMPGAAQRKVYEERFIGWLARGPSGGAYGAVSQPRPEPPFAAEAHMVAMMGAGFGCTKYDPLEGVPEGRVMAECEGGMRVLFRTKSAKGVVFVQTVLKVDSERAEDIHRFLESLEVNDE